MPVVIADKSHEPVVDPKDATAGDDVLARRKALFEKFEREGVSTLDLTKATEQVSAPVEIPPESIIVQTPAGEIEFGPPRGVSVTMRLATMMGEENPNRVLSAMLRTLMFVRSINGKSVTPVTNRVEADYLANQIGDSTLDFLYVTMVETWPPPGKGELQVIRKNKRVL